MLCENNEQMFWQLSGHSIKSKKLNGNILAAKLIMKSLDLNVLSSGKTMVVTYRRIPIIMDINLAKQEHHCQRTPQRM